MCRSARLYHCARCQRQVIICSHCDRGHHYCSGNCAQLSRLEKQQEAKRRYEATEEAKRLKSLRQQRYRQRQKEKATHQGSIQLRLYDLLLVELEKVKKKIKRRYFTGGMNRYCHFCGSQCSQHLRLVFLEQRKSASFSVFF